MDSSSSTQVGPLQDYNTGDLYRLCIPLMILTTLFVGLRVYVRGFMTKTFSWDDWLILPAYVLFMALCVCEILTAWWLSDNNILQIFPKIIKIYLSNTFLFLIEQIFVKLSVAAYFYRICEHWQRWVILSSVAVYSLFTFAFALITLFQCGVPTVPNFIARNAAGTCLNYDRVLEPLTYTAVVLNAAIDWIFVLAALPVLIKLRRMPFREFACVCFLISLATGASVLSLVRIKYVRGKGKSESSVLSSGQTLAVLSFVEVGITIITMCMATLHPLFQACCRIINNTMYSVASSFKKPETSGGSPSERNSSVPSSDEMSTAHSSIGRLGVLPTFFDTEVGTMVEQKSPRIGHNNC